VRSLHDKTSHAFTGFRVEMFGRTEDHLVADNPGLNRVLIDDRGYSGNETVALVGDGDPNNQQGNARDHVDRFDQPADIFGGTGNITLGRGPDEQAWGDGGNAALIGGADKALALVDGDPRQAGAIDGTALLVGGTGNDHLEGGSGNDKLYGDEFATLGPDDAG